MIRSWKWRLLLLLQQRPGKILASNEKQESSLQEMLLLLFSVWRAEDGAVFKGMEIALWDALRIFYTSRNPVNGSI